MSPTVQQAGVFSEQDGEPKEGQAGVEPVGHVTAPSTQLIPPEEEPPDDVELEVVDDVELVEPDVELEVLDVELEVLDVELEVLDVELVDDDVLEEP